MDRSRYSSALRDGAAMLLAMRHIDPDGFSRSKASAS
jgi:hypothetical protein